MDSDLSLFSRHTDIETKLIDELISSKDIFLLISNK